MPEKPFREGKRQDNKEKKPSWGTKLAASSGTLRNPSAGAAEPGRSAVSVGERRRAPPPARPFVSPANGGGGGGDA